MQNDPKKNVLGMGAAPQPLKKNTGFTNIQDINKSNLGAGSALANKVSGVIGQQQQKAQDTISGVSSAFKAGTEAEKARLAESQKLKQAFSGDNFSPFQDETKKQGVMDLVYGVNKGAELGAQHSQGMQQGTQAINTAQQGISQLGSESGRADLLAKTLKSGRFSRGAGILDQSIMQTEGANALQAAKIDALNRMAGTSGSLKDFLAAGSEASDISNQAANISKEFIGETGTGGLIGEANKRFIDRNTAEMAELQKKNTDFLAKVGAKDFKLSNLSANELKELGISSGYVGDLGKTLKDNLLQKQFSLQDTMDKQDLSTYSALQGLLKGNTGVTIDPTKEGSNSYIQANTENIKKYQKDLADKIAKERSDLTFATDESMYKLNTDPDQYMVPKASFVGGDAVAKESKFSGDDLINELSASRKADPAKWAKDMKSMGVPRLYAQKARELARAKGVTNEAILDLIGSNAAEFGSKQQGYNKNTINLDEEQKADDFTNKIKKSSISSLLNKKGS
jgi:hypothetical protein